MYVHVNTYYHIHFILRRDSEVFIVVISPYGSVLIVHSCCCCCLQNDSIFRKFLVSKDYAELNLLGLEECLGNDAVSQQTLPLSVDVISGAPVLVRVVVAYVVKSSVFVLVCCFMGDKH